MVKLSIYLNTCVFVMGYYQNFIVWVFGLNIKRKVIGVCGKRGKSSGFVEEERCWVDGYKLLLHLS